MDILPKSAQKVYILRIYSIKHYFAKNRVLSLGYPMGMFGVTFGAISCLTRAGLDEDSTKHGAKVQKILNICK